jgi:glycosyltransferase involved in cell wall biosynthesis
MAHLPSRNMRPAVPKIAISINACWNFVNFRGGLIRALVAEGFDVVAIAPADDWSERVAGFGCRFLPLPIDSKSSSPLHDLDLMARYRRLLKAERPDLFLGYTIKPNLYGSLAARSLGIPVINNISGLGTAFIRGGWLGWLVRRLYRVALAGSRTVFFQNSEDRDLFVEDGLVRAEQARLLPGSGIDLAHFSPDAAPRNADGPFTFLMIARLLADKGVREYAEAARIVRAEAPDVRFRLLGFLNVQNKTAIGVGEVERWVAEGVLDYLGDATDVRPRIAAADCIVLPSYREGLPRTLLEGAAMAKPLIATDVPGCRQVVVEGVNGFLCAAADARSLADAMLKMIRLPLAERLRMGATAREKVEAEFDEKIAIHHYLDAIGEALAAR